MKRSYFVVGGLALLAFILTYALLFGAVVPKPVVVASTDLTAGTRLTADLLEVRTLPGSAVPDGAYTTLAEAEGKLLTTARVAGDPITAYVAGESSAASGIPAQLTANTVAISIQVDQATGLAGVLRPGQTVTIIAIIDPSVIQQNALYSLTSPMLEAPAASTNGATPTPLPPTPTPQPPVSPAARIVITGLKVLVVPQSFRYEESATTGSSDSFLPARTTASQQSQSVILLEAPLTPLEIAPGLLASPAELLALLNQTAVIHLALEPADGLTIRVDAVPAINLAELYQSITGYQLNPPERRSSMVEKIPIGIAGPDLNQISREYTGLVASSSNFVLAMLSNSWRAFLEALKESEPALLIIYADIAAGPDALKSILGTLKRAVVIVLLPPNWAQFSGVFEGLTRVRKVYVLPAAPKEVLAQALSAINTENALNRSTAPLQGTAGGTQIAAVGTRVIAFVSAQGGVGRSTLAEAMGFELAARRSIRTLLFSFDLPSSAPLRLGTRFAPSAAEYLQRTEGGFKDAVQTSADGLDVIIAPPESTAYAGAAREGEQAKIHDLVNEAYRHHYAAILLDLPADESAWMIQPLRVANTIVLVSRPTTEGVRASGHVLKLLTEVVGAQHRFGHEAFFTILNQRTAKSIYSAPAFASELAKYNGWSPPVLSVVDYDPGIPRAQDDTRPAASASETLGKAAATLVETFYGNPRGEGPLRKTFKIGRIKIRPSTE